MPSLFALTALLFSTLLGSAIAQTAEASEARGDAPLKAPLRDTALLTRFCTSCHGPDEQEADLRFDKLGELPAEDRAELLGRAREMIAFREMPPSDALQPNAHERARLESWLAKQVESSAGGAVLREQMRLPANGNLIDHDALFSAPGKNESRGYSPARRWLVSPQIFHERVMDVFKLKGRMRERMLRRSFTGVTNPFVLPEHSGVRYYDRDALDGGKLLVMLGNAAWIADRQILVARLLGGDKVEFPSKRDRWTPRPPPKSYAAFAPLLQPDAVATESDMRGAIVEQFDCVLRRPPREAELLRYVSLMESARERGGNRAGLRQMLVAVLLESEFVYRLEFGAGDKDAHGRRRLTPREAADAISYALGDRRPDPELRRAAAEGRLATREDLAREVKRLLGDQNYYRGPIDKSLDGKHYKSNVTSHPRIVRFFREFFGYPAATKVFKDPPRSGGIYRNPGRGTTATPGWLILETDRLVTRIVEGDKRVFEELLTSDEFFVYHDHDDATGRAIIEEWRTVYERLRDSAWRTKPKEVLEEHLAFLKTKKRMRIKDSSRPGELVNYMHYFEESFGKGKTPFTKVPWAHGYTLHHAPLYNLPPTPAIGRYGSWKSTKYRSKLAPRTFWDYPVEQPFRIEKRRGILTHPSWLIAHSTNFHSDGIRRGRWIREKLLAGRVPDIPITVDAQIPEHPAKTFRQRVEEVTSAKSCWRCHKHMNPLGLPFEAFDDFGRYREQEALEHPENLLARGNGKTSFDRYPFAAVETTGRLDGSGDPALDGDVADPFELITRLSKADRVRQSIIRHAFRFFFGRNERLSDAKTLRDADQSYVASGGSFRAVIVSLLSSEAFLFRKKTGE